MTALIAEETAEGVAVTARRAGQIEADAAGVTVPRLGSVLMLASGALHAVASSGLVGRNVRKQ
ncbi:MAG: hypothetical protein M3526_06980 [Actinomycetota bacterium]|nr:hypothetical protein [Actinomycetota bacterium]